MRRFLDAVSFEQGEQPAYGDLPDLFVAGGRLIRNSGEAPEIATVAEFVHTRQRALDAGELTSFDETELAATTELFGNVAHRFSTYAKRSVTNGVQIDLRGAISTQLIRTAEGWRISSMAWDDERPGLALSAVLPRIDHVALWTDDLERLRGWYESRLGGRAGELYVNGAGFSSYFVELGNGARLELMHAPNREPGPCAHIAFSLGSHERVDELAAALGAVEGPRTTGDGYYEAVVLDPDGNRVELTA
jgi:catechol 2,3-dioxygenase-like lactoylglutathione lyase family enzyme